MKYKQHGFTVVEVAVLIIVIAILCLLGFIAYKQLHKSSTPSSSLPSSTAANTPTDIKKQVQPANSIILDESKLPGGWANDANYSKYPGTIVVQDSANGCYVQSTYTTDTTESNSPSIDHYSDTVISIKSKGYQVEQSDSTLNITTQRGTRQLRSIILKESLSGATTYQEYAFVSTQSEFLTIQLSCNDQRSLENARQVLGTLTFTKI